MFKMIQSALFREETRVVHLIYQYWRKTEEGQISQRQGEQLGHL